MPWCPGATGSPQSRQSAQYGLLRVLELVKNVISFKGDYGCQFCSNLCFTPAFEASVPPLMQSCPRSFNFHMHTVIGWQVPAGRVDAAGDRYWSQRACDHRSPYGWRLPNCPALDWKLSNPPVGKQPSPLEWCWNQRWLARHRSSSWAMLLIHLALRLISKSG